MSVVGVIAACAAIKHFWWPEYEAGLILSTVLCSNVVHGHARNILILRVEILLSDLSPAINLRRLAY
jgi:hypothetical protein